LLSVPGASNTVLEAVVPYSRMSLIQLLTKVLSFSSSISSLYTQQVHFYLCYWLIDWLISFLQIPSQFCSQQTAEDMALLAYNRALKLSSPGCFINPNYVKYYLPLLLYIRCVKIVVQVEWIATCVCVV
jgi:hypothetical protein